ncbi:MAG: RdgB/HAM1 family non-canonical purine NTP pyrophosphatase [Chloroflexota bacterium]|nr:RdgB/HAM1 family non-canonical purine NTP pyrophosphatase [Chloroflexota bacterium]
MGTPHSPTLVLATTNRGKAAEFRALLPDAIPVTTLADLGLAAPEEIGTTFEENARAKALAAALGSGSFALADDSGLEVDALGGAPGVRSARFGGEPAEDARNRRALLSALSGVPPERRAARFVCALALASPHRILAVSEGVCEGRVAELAGGGHGFGYDPIFQLPDGRRMAELRPEEKNRLSHRAVAVRRLLPLLIDLWSVQVGSDGPG